MVQRNRKIRWNPDFPVCRLQYEDSGLPIKIEAEFASPFVPGQEALAGTPGFYVTFTITNPSDQEAEVSILGKLKNPVNRGMEQRRLRNQLTTEKGCAQIVMKSDSKKRTHPMAVLRGAFRRTRSVGF